MFPLTIENSLELLIILCLGALLYKISEWYFVGRTKKIANALAFNHKLLEIEYRYNLSDLEKDYHFTNGEIAILFNELNYVFNFAPNKDLKKKFFQLSDLLWNFINDHENAYIFTIYGAPSEFGSPIVRECKAPLQPIRNTEYTLKFRKNWKEITDDLENYIEKNKLVDEYSKTFSYIIPPFPFPLTKHLKN